jgi:uncharacterized protein (TIRG00374 family)
MSDGGARRSLTEKIEDNEHATLSWKSVLKKVIPIAITGVALYLVFPSITEVFASWPKLKTLHPVWFVAALVAQALHFMCTWALQRIAIRTKAWFPVVAGQLAGNAVTLIVPGGAAVGAAVQFRMLKRAGMDTDATVGGLTTFSLLGVAAILLLPFLALPTIFFGPAVNRSLAEVAIIGAIAFVLFTAAGALVLTLNAPLRFAGRTAQSVANRVRSGKPKIQGLGPRLLTERDQILHVLGERWQGAVALSAARLVFDYLTLYAAVRATGAHPRPSLILVAYAVAGIVSMIPITPGGLGIVEASLTGFLILAGMSSGDALLATLAYRLCSYWLPLLVGPVAYGWFTWRYDRRDEQRLGLAGGAPAG